MQATLQPSLNKPESHPFPTSETLYYLFLFFALLDCALTAYAINFLNATEMNPIANWLWHQGERFGGGFFALLFGKIILGLLLVSLHVIRPTWGRVALWISATIQIAAVTISLLVHLV